MDIIQEKIFTTQSPVKLKKLYLDGEDMDFEKALLIEEKTQSSLHGVEGISNCIVVKDVEGAIELNYSLMDIEMVTDAGVTCWATGSFSEVQHKGGNGIAPTSDAEILIQGKIR